MGRGRGRGRKQLTNGRTHEDKGSSGEEVVVSERKRRGRPQKRVAAKKIIEAEMKKLEAADDGDEDYVVGAGDGAKLKGSRTEHASAGAGGNKRNRVPKDEDDSNLDVEENSSSTRPAMMSRSGPMASGSQEAAGRAPRGERRRQGYSQNWNGNGVDSLVSIRQMLFNFVTFIIFLVVIFKLCHFCVC